MVYYRKYRPQTISELDSSKLRETLAAVLSSPEVPHAFLLTGPKGLGKTSTARIIAKVVNCENKKKGSIEPCNTCEQCVSITNGSNIDVLEIDGASNRGIDEIRDLREKVKLSPSRAKKKVYIIDEVHMLTTEAFNALLKTIEEPPAHVMFLFCTTEPQKVPATILSRCFHVAYTLATEDDLVRSFKRIVLGEKIDIDEEALHMIAQLSEGGFRDGTKILEELVILANGKKITEDFVEEHYKVSGISYLVSGILQAFALRDQKQSFEIIIQLVEQGIDMRYFISQLLDALHKMLLVDVGVLPDTKYQIQDTKYSLSDIQTLVTLFSEAYQQTKYAIIPQMPLELAVIAWCQGQNQESEIKNQENPVILGTSETKTPESNSNKNTTDSGQPRMKIQSNKQTMDMLLKKEKNLKVQAILKGTDEKEEQKEIKVEVEQEELTDKAEGERLMDNLIFKVKPQNHSVAGVLRGCVVKAMGNGKIIFETSYKFHKERLDEAKTRNIIESALKEITGKNMKVMIELKNS